MRFLLLLHGDEAAESALPRDDLMRIVDEHRAFSRRLRDAGAMVAGEALDASTTARIVRPGGGPATTGPFAESREQLGGFYLIEAASMDEAVDWAGQVPASPGLAVEVRPVPEY